MVKTKPATFPTLPKQDDYAVVREAKTVLRNLEVKKQKLFEAIQETETAISNRQRELSDVDYQARRVLKGQAIASPAEVLNRDGLAKLRRELDIVTRAIRLQKTEVDHTITSMAEQACQRLAAPFEELVQRTARYAIAFAEANQQITRVIQHLSAEMLSHGGLLDLNAGCSWIGDPENPNSQVGTWLRVLRKAGHDV